MHTWIRPSWVQGEQPHCGFPEAMYHQNAERLVRAGLRVVVIEQTETPEQLKARNENRQKAEKKVRCISSPRCASASSSRGDKPWHAQPKNGINCPDGQGFVTQNQSTSPSVHAS